MLLVGFMASGKTTVGRRVADLLGWRFLDFDEEVERREARAVARIFAESGEAAFRAAEAAVAVEALKQDRIVLASGGGWAVAPGRLEALPAGTLTVWLDVDPGTAVERATRSGAVRPLLAGDDPIEAARALSARRRPAYARAEFHLDGARASPETLAAAIVDRVRARDPSS